MSHVLAWICLLLVSCAAAYGLQLTTSVVVPPSAAADTAASAPPPRKTLIVAVDRVTGDRAQEECDVPISSYTSDVLLVDASHLPAVVRACDIAGAPAVNSAFPPARRCTSSASGCGTVCRLLTAAAAAPHPLTARPTASAGPGLRGVARQGPLPEDAHDRL
jgi:hypothetical protein